MAIPETPMATDGLWPFIRVDLDNPKHHYQIWRSPAGQQIVSVNIYRDGKRCTIHLSIGFDKNERIKVRMNAVLDGRDVQRVLTARPWVHDKD